jgi:diguanylate cyclase (GGDEF)-like protein
VNLDPQTLFFSLMINVTLMSVALTLGVRWDSRSGIRAWNVALVLQALAWAALIASYRAWPRSLATVGVACMVTGFGFVHVAAKAYLHEPVSRAWAWGLPAVVTLLHWLLFGDYVARIAITNAGLSLQMLWLAVVLLRPRPTSTSWRWRWLAGVALASSGLMVLGRFVLVVGWPEAYPRFDAAHWINTLGLIINNANLTVGTLAFLLAHRDEAERELQRLATTDGLTGVLNRRQWLAAGLDHLRLAERHGQPLTVMMLDLDHFKRINDNQGHAAGDRALVQFSRALQHVLRGPDLVGRYGGEEFCVLLPQSGLDAAEAVDRRLRELVAREVVPTLGFPLTFSAGVALRDAGDASLERLMASADEALYRAKAAGRNRLERAVSRDAGRTPPTPG